MARYAYHQVDRNQPALVEWFKARGCRYWHIQTPVDGLLSIPTAAGWVTVPVEWKGRKGKLQPVQEKFLAQWPAKTAVIRDEFEAAILLKDVGWNGGAR